MKGILVLSAAFLFFAMPVSAQEIFFDTDQQQINVTSDFHGENLVVFGNRPGDGDLAVVVEGPQKEIIVRKKGRIMGAWLNKESVTFKGVPEFYSYAATSGIDDEYEAATKMPSSSEKRGSADYNEFYKALIATRQNQDLYAPERGNVQIYEDGRLFRADFKIPSNVPVGDYKVSIYYHQDGMPIKEEHSLSVAQTGVNAKILQFAQYNSFLYGLSCVMLALFAGWFSNKFKLRR